MSRFRLTIAYDGTAYFGWQAQPGKPTVQEAIEAALARLTGEKPRVHASGRTDTGVHAAGQVAHVELARGGDAAHPRRKPFAAKELAHALNALLPADIRILKCSRAAEDFHARFSAKEKEYRYRIWNAPVLPPDLRFTFAHVPKPELDLAAMRRAAKMLAGTHDFAAFSANPHRETNGTVRTLKKLAIVRDGEKIEIRAVGDGFLYKMVRSLAGHLIRVGKGAVAAEETRAILESKTRTARVETAPAKGLTLWRVLYPRHP